MTKNIKIMIIIVSIFIACCIVFMILWTIRGKKLQSKREFLRRRVRELEDKRKRVKSKKIKNEIDDEILLTKNKIISISKKINADRTLPPSESDLNTSDLERKIDKLERKIKEERGY